MPGGGGHPCDARCCEAGTAVLPLPSGVAGKVRRTFGLYTLWGDGSCTFVRLLRRAEVEIEIERSRCKLFVLTNKRAKDLKRPFAVMRIRTALRKERTSTCP